MTDAEKLSIVDEMADWDSSVFSAEGDPRGYWLETRSFETVLYLLRAADGGKLLGYTTIKYFEMQYDGRPIYVEKVGIGVLPEHRGNKFSLRSILLEYLRCKLRYPTRELYLFSTLIHPVTYKLVVDVFGKTVYPYFEGPQDPEKEKLTLFMAGQFGLKKADSPHPFVYIEEYTALENREANKYWKTSTRPEVRFFVEHCPNYDVIGEAFVATARFSLSVGAARSIKTLARNRIDKALGRKHKFNKRERDNGA